MVGSSLRDVLGGSRYVRWVYSRKAALRPVPNFAVVDSVFVEAIERQLEEEDEELQETLDQGFRDLDRRQPVLAPWLSEQLAAGRDELVQSLGYFLVVTVYLAFREAFPTRLGQIDDGGLGIAESTLAVDEELRAADPSEVLESDDIVALGQPALLSFVQHHVQEALEQAEGQLDLEELDDVYRAVLVEVIALTHAVGSPDGDSAANVLH